MAKISVVIPTKNRFNYLKECVQSLQLQTYKDFEILIIDDGSTPENLKQILELCGNIKNCRVICREQMPSGASACRNLGIKQAIGQFIIFLDSDDLLAPHCLHQRIETMKKNTDLDFAIFPMLIFNVTPGDSNFLWNKIDKNSDLDRFLRLDSVWQTSGPIWCKSALDRIEGFDDSLACWQDIDIHLKAFFSGLKYKIFEDLPPDAYYRKHQEGSISQNSLNSYEKIKSRITLFSWAYQRIKEINASAETIRSAKEMLLGILLSMGTTLQLGWLLRTIRKPHIQILLSADEKKMVISHALMYKCRLYKIKPLLKYQVKKINKHFSPKHVGKFSY